MLGLEPRSLRSLGTSPLPRDFAPPRSPVVGLEPRSLRSLGTSPLPRDFAPPRSPVVGRVQGPMRVRLSIVLAGVLVIAAAPSALAMTPEERTDPIPVGPRAILSLVAGFALPVDAPLDLRADLLPGAPRAYRGGTHEGVDFLAPYGAPVRAARAGIVLRIDRDYAEWPWTLRAAAL